MHNNKLTTYNDLPSPKDMKLDEDNYKGPQQTLKAIKGLSRLLKQPAGLERSLEEIEPFYEVLAERMRGERIRVNTKRYLAISVRDHRDEEDIFNSIGTSKIGEKVASSKLKVIEEVEASQALIENLERLRERSSLVLRELHAKRKAIFGEVKSTKAQLKKGKERRIQNKLSPLKSNLKLQNHREVLRTLGKLKKENVLITESNLVRRATQPKLGSSQVFLTSSNSPIVSREPSLEFYSSIPRQSSLPKAHYNQLSGIIGDLDEMKREPRPYFDLSIKRGSTQEYNELSEKLLRGGRLESLVFTQADRDAFDKNRIQFGLFKRRPKAKTLRAALFLSLIHI
eukprot:TRINITY_DN14751_c0_g1_i2.p1 TRINITY_DN14751_c0_g1~~TRINITY_DN14751_c0_g1_i2.p1  ORF type:complete len:341 (-),score=71.82 TRINITY_DN14751_c0_g1_i2:2-1024(-)